MPARDKIDLIITAPVAANSTDSRSGNVLPDGKRVHVRKIGCCIPNASGYIGLYFGSQGNFQPIRFINGNSELIINKDFMGDGQKMFRVDRVNESGSPARMFFWLEGEVI